MKKGLETLFSKYIIDGTVMDSTPADMLSECFLELDPPAATPDTIIDETPDSDPAPFKYDVSRIGDYLADVSAALGHLREEELSPVSLSHPVSSVRVLVAESILKALWRPKPVRLDELSLGMSVLWDPTPVGNMAAFHGAMESACGYIYELGLRIGSFDYGEAAGHHDMGLRIAGSASYGDPIPQIATDCPDSVLIYIPFDTCSHRLGGSLFGQTLGRGDETGPEISDPDYFIDCFEVVHELVEDGVALSGVTVGRGGLLAAVDRILGTDRRIDLDINGIQRACMESDRVRVLFSEIPGALVQIRDSESGYVDSQLLLQDIAYYTLGSVQKLSGKGSRKGRTGSADVSATGQRARISLQKDNKADLSKLLSALLNGPMPEDPDISNVSEGTERRDGK